MRLLLALLALLTVSAARAPDWTRTITVTRDGAYVLGNPKARVRLVEYASYTCPHCAHFSAESSAPLKAMIRSGSTSWEFRHLVRDRLDLAAVILARCVPRQSFFATTEAIFAAQGQWLERGYQFQQLNGSQLALYSQSDQLRVVADGAGLSALVQARGVTPAATAACFADDTAVARITATTAAIPDSVTGTPTFFINGRVVPNAADWTRLQPALRVAGAR